MVKFKIIEPPDFSDTATTAVAEPANVFRGGEEEKKPSAPKLPKEEKVTFTIPKPPSSEDGVASPFSSPRNDAIREGRELEQKKITNIKADSFFRKLKKISEWNYKQGERAEESGKLANLQWAGKITIEEMLAQDIELQKKYANMGDDPTPSWEQNKFWDIYGAGVKLLPFQFGAFKKGAIGAAAGWLVGAIATPFMPGDDVLLAAAGAKLGPKLAGAIGKKAIQATGARVGGGSAVVNYSMNIEGGNIYIDLIKRGVDPELAKKASRIGGLAIGLVEVAKFGAIAKFLPGIGSKAVRAALKTSSFRVALGKALKEWGSMYGQEVSEEYIQKVIENATIMAAEALDDGVTPSYRDVVDKLFDNAWVEAKAAAKGMLLTSGLLGGAAIGTSSVGSVLREKAKESTRRQVFEGTKSGTAPDVLIGAARMRDNLIGEELKEGVAYGEDGFFHKREGRTDKLIEEKDLTERQKEISYLDQAVSNKASNAIAKKYGIRFKKFGERDNFKWKLLKDTLTGTKVKIAWKGKPEIVDTEFEVVGNEGSPQTGKYDALTPEETKDVKGTALKLLNNFTKKGKKGKPGKPVVTYDELTPFLQARLLDYIAKAKESGVTEADMETGPFLSKFFVGIKDKEGNVLDHGTKNLVEYIGGQLDVEGGDIKVWLGLVRGLVAIKDIPGFLAQAGMKFSDLQFVALKLKGYSNVTKVRATILAEVKKQAQQQKDLKDTIDDSYYVDIDSQTDSSDSSTTKPVKDVSLPEQEGVVPSQTVEKKVETEAVEVIEKIKQDNATKKSNRNLKKGDEQTQAKPTEANVWYGSKENAELSSLASRPFIHDGREYISVEHAYQSLKSGKFDQATYNKYKVPGKKIVGLKGTDKANSIPLMEVLVAESFEQNPEAMDKLRATGNTVLTHKQDKGVWGKEFPRILMDVRDAKANKDKPWDLGLVNEPAKVEEVVVNNPVGSVVEVYFDIGEGVYADARIDSISPSDWQNHIRVKMVNVKTGKVYDFDVGVDGDIGGTYKDGKIHIAELGNNTVEWKQAKPTVTESKGIGSTIEQMPGLPRGVLPRAKFGLKTKVRFTTINALRRRLNKIGDIRDSIKIIATDSEAFANGVKIKDSIDKDFLAAFITDDRKTIYINKKVMDIWWKHYSKRKKIKGWNRKSKSESGYWLLDLLPKGMSKREFFRFAAEHEMVHLITGLDGEQIDELLVTVLALERIGRVEDAQYLQQFASITRAPLQKLEKIIVPLEDIRGTEGLQYQTTQKDLVDMSNVPCKVNPVYLDPDNLLEIDKMAGTNQSFSSSRKAPIAKKKILTELNQGLLTDEWRQENIVSLNRMVDEFLRYHPSIEGNTTTKAGVNKIINNFTPDEKLAFYKLLKSKDKETGVQNVYLNHEVNDGTITPDVYNNVPGEGVNFWGEKVGGEKPEAMQDGDAYNNNMKVSKVNNTEDQIRNELGWKIKHFYEAISGLLYAKRRISRKVAKTAWEKKRVNMKLSNGAIHKLTLFLKQHGVNEPIADTDTGILNQLYATGVFKESSESYPRAVGIWYNEEIYDPKWPNKQRAMAISSMPLCKNELANLLSMNDQNVKFHEDDINDRIAHQGALWQLAKDKDGNAVNEGSVVDRIDKVTEEETVQITEFINDQVDSVGPEIIQEEETAAQKKLRHDLNVFWADRRSSDLLEMQKIMQEISDDEAGKLNAPEDIKKETDEEYYGMEGDESEDSVGEVEIQDGLFGLGGIFGFTKKGSGDTKTNNTRSPSTEAEQFRVGIRMLLNATRFFGANDSNVLDAIDHYANPNWTKKIPKVPSKLRGVFHEIVEPLMLFRRSATTSALYGAMMVNVVVKEIAGVADKDMGGKRIRSGAWLKRYKFYSALLCRAVEELQPGNKYSEIGKGGPHNTPVIARNYLKDMTHFWNATHDTPATPQQEQGWLNNRDPLSFTTLLPTELQGLVAWVQNEIAAPLLQEQLDKGIFDSASTYALRREGWFRRWANIDTDEKGKQQTAVSSEIPAKREYYAFSDFIDIAENKAHMDAAQDFAAICGEYVTGSLNKLTKANILQEFLGMTALDEEHPDWTLVMYATKVKVPAVVNGESTANWTREEKGAWKNGYLQDRGFTQMKSAPGLAGWSFGKFQAPWVHSSVANLIRTFTETSRKSQWLKSWFAINRIVKLMVMFTPFMYMMQIVSTPFAWVPRLLPKTIKGVAMMLPAGLKQSVLRFQGRKDPFSHLKGQNYDYKKLYWLLQAGLPGFNVDYAMKALFEREIDLSHPMTKTILHNAYKVVRSKGGMEDYAFDRFIASHIYALSSKFYDDFMARGWGEEVSARRAAMLVGDITGMVNSSIYGNEGQFLQAFLFARDFTMTFFRQVTGALGLKFIVPGSRDFQTGPRHVFNSLLHGEKSVADMQALQPLYFAHLMKIMMWRISLVNMTQFGLMMMLGDEEDKKKPWAYQNSGTMSKLFIKLPWKNKEGKQMYLDPLMLREPSQLIGWPTKPGRMFRGKMNYAVSVAWDLMKNRDYRDRLIYPESSAMGVSEGFRTKKKARYVWDAALPTAFDKNAQFQGWWFQVLSSLGLNVKVDHWTEKGHSKDEIVAIKGWQATLRWLNDDFSRFLETTTPQEQLELASRGKLTPTQLFNLYKKRNFRISSVKYDEAMTLYKSLWKYRDIIDLPTARRDIFSR